MPYRTSDHQDEGPAQMYKRGHDAHYKKKDIETADAVYKELMEKFPGSPEAGYAKSQLDNMTQSYVPREVSLEPVTLEGKITARFSCARCEHKECNTKRVAMTGAGLSRLLDVQKEFYLALTCQQCGLTDFYDLNLLEQRGEISDSIFDLMFGG